MERRRLSAGDVVIRFASPSDLEAIVSLCIAHAAYEKAEIDPGKIRESLGAHLFTSSPRAWCAVAEADGELVAYTTWSREFSTWHAAEYVHMDCLYVRDEHRNAGLGRLLLDFVARAAAMSGCEFIEWQTPHWNVDAMRFYERAGAVPSPKVRYRWRAWPAA
jgi:GNAT superfamily N-acetyltransferase